MSGTGIRQISHRFMSQTGLLLLSLILQILRFSTSLSPLSHQKTDPITLLHGFAIKSSMFKGDCLSLNTDNGPAFLSRYVMLPTLNQRTSNEDAAFLRGICISPKGKALGTRLVSALHHCFLVCLFLADQIFYRSTSNTFVCCPLYHCV